MYRLLSLLVLALLGLTRPAAALDPGTADGSVTLGGKSIDLTTAYATHYFNDQGLADGPELRILLADREVDGDLLSGPLVDAIERAAGSGQVRGVLLRVDPEKLGAAPVRGTLLMPLESAQGSLMHFTITKDAGGFEDLKVSKNRVLGRASFRSTGGDVPAFSYGAKFSAPLFKDEPTARLIGEPAQESPAANAVLAFERALWDGDMASVSAHTTPERFAGLDADFARVGPAMFLKQARAQLPDPVVRKQQVREVVMHGRRGWVVLVSDEGTRIIASVVHTDGVWKVD